LSRVVLHCAPHPDDELIGAPATLMALRDAGWRVVNLACGLGRVGQRARREEELREACRLAGFELRLPHRQTSIASDADPARAGAELAAAIREALADLRPQLVVSPGPHELHPTHALVAGAVRDAAAELRDSAPHWWMWAVWGSLRQPTLATRFERTRLEEVLTALAAHRSELGRNDYRRLVEGRAAMSASLAPELIFGFGATVPGGAPCAELLTEAVFAGERWYLGERRWLDPASPLGVRSEIEALVGC
jgi:LmbE family N-acetylglucosaminyl deacetylase